jgi:hypothetical protein
VDKIWLAVKRVLLTGVIAAAVVFIAFILQTLFQIYPWSLDSLNFTQNRAEWPSVQGTVSLSSDRNTQGYVSVSFEYQVKSAHYFTMQRWSGDQTGFFNGQTVKVHYNPANPAVAVINTAKSEMPPESSIFVFIIGLIVLGALAGIVVWACWGLDPAGITGVALGLVLAYFRYGRLGIVYWIIVGVAVASVIFVAVIAIRSAFRNTI